MYAPLYAYLSASAVKEARRIIHGTLDAAGAKIIPEKCDTSIWTRPLNVGPNKSGPTA